MDELASIGVENKKISQTFYNLIEEFAQSFEKPKEIFKQIVEQGRKENLTDMEIDMIVNSYLKGRIKERTLFNYRKEFLQIEDKVKVIEHSTVTSQKNADIDHKNVIEDSSNQEINLSLSKEDVLKQVKNLKEMYDLQDVHIGKIPKHESKPAVQEVNKNQEEYILDISSKTAFKLVQDLRVTRYIWEKLGIKVRVNIKENIIEIIE